MQKFAVRFKNAIPTPDRRANHHLTKSQHALSCGNIDCTITTTKLFANYESSTETDGLFIEGSGLRWPAESS